MFQQTTQYNPRFQKPLYQKVFTREQEIKNDPNPAGITTKPGKRNNSTTAGNITEQLEMKTTKKEDNKKQYKVLMPPSQSRNPKKKRKYNKQSQQVQRTKYNPRKEDNPRVECEIFIDDPIESGPVNGDTRASSPRECYVNTDAQPASTATQILAPAVINNTLSEIKNLSPTTKPDLAGKLEITNKTFTSKTTAWDRD